MEISFANLPIMILIAMIVALLSSLSMLTACSLAALAILVVQGAGSQELLSRAAPNIITVLVVMSTTQLAIHNILRSGAGDRVSVWVAMLAAQRWLRRVPSAMLLPLIFVPLTMLLAALFHNVTGILIAVPLAIDLCRRYEVRSSALLSAMLISSNLGGASMATGDTPAIIQRQLWGFTPIVFTANMLPINLIVLAVLTAITCFVTWLPDRQRKVNWFDTLKRLKARDHLADYSRYSAAEQQQAIISAIALATFIGLQFAFPKYALVTGCLVLGALICFTPREKHVEAYTALGLEAIIVIVSLFIVASAVEHTPVVHYLAEYLKSNQRGGAIEFVAYLLTTGISADGSAATLAPVVHRISAGSFSSAWALASGICAGSSTLLTAASAGAIINAVSRRAGCELTFRTYSAFGVPFSIVMMVLYLTFNLFAR